MNLIGIKKGFFVVIFMLFLVLLPVSLANNISEALNNSFSANVTNISEKVSNEDLSSLLSNALNLNNSLGTESNLKSPIQGVQGSIVEVEHNNSNSSSFYLQVGVMPQNIDTKEINFGNLKLVNYGINKDTIWELKLVLTNTENNSKDFNINLFNYPSVIESDFLSDVDYLSIKINNSEISNLFAFKVNLDAGDSKIILISFKTPNIKVKKDCKSLYLKDLIPKGAKIIQNNVSLDELIQDSCDIQIYYESEYLYPDMVFDLNNFTSKDILNIYDSNGGFVPITNNSLKVSWD